MTIDEKQEVIKEIINIMQEKSTTFEDAKGVLEMLSYQLDYMMSQSIL